MLLRATRLLACLATAWAGFDEDLVRQHSLMFASEMNQDDEIDGFHQEDFEAELQHVRRQHERLASAGASRPSLGPLIEQALNDPNSLARVTESIANLGAGGDSDASAVHQQLLEADPSLGAGMDARRKHREAMMAAASSDRRSDAFDGDDDTPLDISSDGGGAADGGGGGGGAAAEGGGGWNAPGSASARGAPGFGYRAGGLRPLKMDKMRHDIDHAFHQLRREDYRSDEL